MAGGKGKSVGGKGAPKETAGKTQKSHSAKAGLQVSTSFHRENVKKIRRLGGMLSLEVK